MSERLSSLVQLTHVREEVARNEGARCPHHACASGEALRFVRRRAPKRSASERPSPVWRKEHLIPCSRKLAPKAQKVLDQVWTPLGGPTRTPNLVATSGARPLPHPHRRVHTYIQAASASARNTPVWRVLASIGSFSPNSPQSESRADPSALPLSGASHLCRPRQGSLPDAFHRCPGATRTT